MRDQETDMGGNGLSIIGGPSLEPVTELSTELFRFWNSISSWGFRFEGYKMWCGFISLDQFRFKVRVIGETQTLDLFSMAGGFPSFAVGGEGDKGEAPNMFYPQPPSVISNLNPLFLFTSTLRATTSSPFTSLEPYTRCCLLLAPISKGAYALHSLPTPLVTTKRRSRERKEGLEPSTSALARLCSTIKLFPPATVVAKHY
ncbi:hypothetical protein SLA2020_492300 [Shorea laevis]